MQCTSCQAILAPGAANCLFCGSAQASAVHGTPRGGLTHAHAQLMLLHKGASETWRVWLAFFMCGLYAPAAGAYLYGVAEHQAGISGAAPPAPSGRGALVLGLFFLVPLFAILSVGPWVEASDVYWDFSALQWRDWGGVYLWGLFTLPVAWFYVYSMLLARRRSRRFRVLLYEVTKGSHVALSTFDAGMLRRLSAQILSVLPVLVLSVSLGVMHLSGWGESLSGWPALYLLVVAIAAWSASWLHIDAARRFYKAANHAAP